MFVSAEQYDRSQAIKEKELSTEGCKHRAYLLVPSHHATTLHFLQYIHLSYLALDVLRALDILVTVNMDIYCMTVSVSKDMRVWKDERELNVFVYVPVTHIRECKGMWTLHVRNSHEGGERGGW